MQKFRKKPVVIEAIPYDGSNAGEILFWIGQYHNPDSEKKIAYVNKVNELIITTLEGDHLASIGDFIIKGVKNEFYPCKPDIFEATYEKVEE